MKAVVGLLAAVASHHLGDDVYGHREHDGAVLLRRDAVQSLQIAQLEWTERERAWLTQDGLFFNGRIRPFFFAER